MSDYPPPRPPAPAPPPGHGAPPPPGYGPPPTAAPDRPWWKRPWVIVVAVLAALVALGAIVGPSEEEGDESAGGGSGTTLGRDPGGDDQTTTTGPLGAELIASDDIEAGVCFDEPTTASSLTDEDEDEDEAGATGTTVPETVFAVPALDCSEPHRFEATGEHELEGEDDAYPGLEAMAAAAEAPCEARFAEHVGVSSDESVHHSLALLLPTEASWQDGGRTALCVAEADDFAEIRGEVEGQGPSAVVNTVDLVVGDCFFDGAGTDVVRVACDSPHDSEVVGFHTSTLGDAYPGADAITADGDPACAVLFTELVGEDPDDSDLQVSALFFPTEAGWAAGDRSITCVAYADDLSLLDAPAAG